MIPTPKAALCLRLSPPLAGAVARMIEAIGGPGWYDAVLADHR